MTTPIPKYWTYISVLKPNDIQLICFPAYSARVSVVEILGGSSNKKLILFYPIKGKIVHPPVKARSHGKVPWSGMKVGRKAEFSKKGTE